MDQASYSSCLARTNPSPLPALPRPDPRLLRPNLLITNLISAPFWGLLARSLSACKASSTPVAQFFLLESFGGNAGM